MVVVAGALTMSTPALAVDTTTSTVTSTVPPIARSWVLVDVDTGRVIEEQDAHERRRPGSTIKLLTVLTARALVPDSAIVPVSRLAASMPARSVGLRPGARWTVGQITDAVLLVSANDAAVALAERASGTLDRFALELRRVAREIGVVDAPVLDDPTGLDHTYDHGNGDWISAWDLALVGRRALDDPKIAATARLSHVDFVDAAGTSHHLLNRDELIGRYPGATGLKTGFTHAAGNCLVATATRAGRTMLAVLMGSADLYRDAGLLLDRGFATPVVAESGPRLDGAVVPPVLEVTATTSTTRVGGQVVKATSDRLAPSDRRWWWAVLAAGASAALIALWFRRRRSRRTP